MSPDQLVHAIAERLADQACDTELGATWRAADVDARTANAPEADVGGTLYQGSAGIGLFLSWVPGFEGHAAGALWHATRWCDETGPQHGLHTGTLGTLRAVSSAAEALPDRELLARAEALRQQHETSLADDPAAGCDLASGFAGTLVCCRNRAGQTIERLGSWIAQAATEEPTGHSWPYLPPGYRSSTAGNLTGMPHGAVGIAAALAAAGPGLGIDVDAEIRAGLRYESACSSWVLLDWSRGRSEPERPATWCRGIAGGVAARLELVQRCRSSRLESELAARLESLQHRAVAALRLDAFGPADGANLSVCHGLSGMIDALHSASLVLGADEHRNTAWDLTDKVIDLLRDDGFSSWPCGTSDGREHPSLYLGLAGLGLTVRRLLSPQIPGPTGLAIGTTR